MELREVQEVSSYSLLTFEPLHKLHLGIIHVVEGVHGELLSFDRLKTGGGLRGGKPFVTMPSRVV